MQFLSSLSRIGTAHATTEQERNEIIITNQVSCLLGVLPLAYIALNVYNQGWLRITLPIVAQPLLFLIPVLLNSLGFTRFSRLYVCWCMSVLAVIFSVYNKLNGLDLQTAHYIGFRFSILASAVIPFLVFRLKDNVLMVMALFPSLFVLLAFDPIHNAFGVGYAEAGLTESGYGLTTMRVMIAYLLICGSSLFLKRSVEKNEDQNRELIRQLTEKNTRIQTQLAEISSQHEQITGQKKELETQFKELSTHRDQLHHNEARLSDALETIKTQQEVLLGQNKSLEFEVLNKNKELLENNQQLIRYNNELQQFSYTVSHNLRGPVATILGLLNLYDNEDSNAQSPVYSHLKKTVYLLDEIILDLNRILDIRNEVAQVRKRVDVKDVVLKTKETFQKDINQFNIVWQEEYHHTQDLYSIPSLINSIIYNLASNAIKYRSVDRRPEIRITTLEEGQYFIITVRDNGIGLDVEAHREKLFQLYKRFNLYTEGKGIGLYLIKLQTEMLGGTVHVASELNQFTEFIIRLPLGTNP
jgi:signal transduction histidine kinase